MSIEKALEEWKKHDPLLQDSEGFQRFAERFQRFQELHSQVTTWNEKEWGPKEIKKYRGIWGVFASKWAKEPQRFCGFFYSPVDDLSAFEEKRRKLEKKFGDKFLCFEVMHEETLDHNPDRPQVKGNFGLYTYYNYDFEQISKPELMKKIEKYLRKVSRWQDRGGSLKGEPEPIPPLGEEFDESS